MFKGEIAKCLSRITGLDEGEAEGFLETPPSPELGDYSFPCFQLARKRKENPSVLAEMLATEFSCKCVGRVESKGPYLNFFLKEEAVFEALEKPRRPGGKGVVVIEYSSPNIARPFGVGHLRSTLIGQALRNIYAYKGWRTIAINHPGDWGTQFGYLIAAYKKWHVPLEEDPVKKLFKLYVKFNREAEKNPSLKEEGKEWFKKLEQGDEEALKLWRRFKDLSMKEFEKVYNALGVSFDHVHGESFYQDKMRRLVKLLREKGLLVESEGAMVVDLSKHGMPPCIVLKSDGATTYATRDLAAAIYRYETFRFDKMLYEVGSEQQLHFKQFFKVLELAGFEWVRNCFHVSHGLYRFNNAKMSTRKGNVVFAEDLLAEAKSKVLGIINEKNPALKDKEGVAEAVGVGAIIFNDLKNDRVKDINFSWEEALNMEGDSGPYVQYTHARAASILRKAGGSGKPSWDALRLPEEVELAKHLLRLEDVLDLVVEENKPHFLARWLLDLARMFNNYYQKHRIISSAEEDARLWLTGKVKDGLMQGLALLNIRAPEEM